MTQPPTIFPRLSAIEHKDYKYLAARTDSRLDFSHTAARRIIAVLLSYPKQYPRDPKGSQANEPATRYREALCWIGVSFVEDFCTIGSIPPMDDT